MLNINQYQTYMAASSAFTPGATPQDVFTITGNANTNVYVQKIALSSTQGTAGINEWLLLKRSAANSGGTNASVTAIPLNSKSAPADATVLQYTGNATAGASVGQLWAGWVNSPIVTTAGIGDYQGIIVDFESMYGQPLALLSAAEVLAWNFGGAALPSGLSVLAWVQWFEMSKSA